MEPVWFLGAQKVGYLPKATGVPVSLLGDSFYEGSPPTPGHIQGGWLVIFCRL